MNTKPKKYLSIFIILAFVGGLASYLFFITTPRRQIATQNTEAKDLTETQKQKWAVVEQFQIRQTNESLQIDIPHLVDLCQNNQSIVFELSAYELNISGSHPTLKLDISCQISQEKLQTQFEITYADLISLQKLKQKPLSFGALSAKLIYSDEKFPQRWNLSEISIEGINGFKINQFEIQKVFGNNFEFELN